MKKSVIVLLHLAYWLMYLILLSMFFILLNVGFKRFIFQNFNAILFFVAFAIIPGFLSFYTFYTVLFSRFLSRKKIISLIIFSILISIACGLLGWAILFFLWDIIKTQRGATINQGGPGEFFAIITIMSVNAFANGVIGLVMKGFISWYGDIKLKDQLRQKNFEMELALVKSQMSPHFLFNTINNIDVLIEKDAAMASKYLNKLSDIMRFMLYETKIDKISIDKELTYIDKYLELQKIRSSNPNFVSYTVQNNATDWMIESMLFIPFIENAFKHAENKKIDNGINIRILIEKNAISFDCSNHYNERSYHDEREGGLGNQLIEKRLKLLYPLQHQLKVSRHDQIYSVSLAIYRHGN